MLVYTYYLPGTSLIAGSRHRESRWKLNGAQNVKQGEWKGVLTHSFGAVFAAGTKRAQSRRVLMPKVTIWIKNEDKEFWDEIKDRPAFIHDAIRVQRNSLTGSAYGGKEDFGTFSDAQFASPIGKCEHYQPKGGCLIQGCKYGRMK